MVEQYWTNRLGWPEDNSAIWDLVRRVYPDRSGLDWSYWQWRYLSDTDFRAVIIMAEHEGRPIAIRPMAFFDFQWGEERLKGVMHSAVLTHPDHRRRGIFRSMVASSNEYLARQGAQFSISMPNDLSVQGFLRWSDWHHAGFIPLYLKVADGSVMLRPRLGRAAAALLGWMPHPFFRRRGDPIGKQAFDCEQVTTMPNELDEVFDLFARDCETLMIRRTTAYWNWRYLARPNVAYRTLVARRAGRMMGVVATSVQKRAGLQLGMVLDIVGRGGLPVLRQLLRDAEAELVSRGAGLVTCQATSPILQRALREEGYRCPKPEWLPKRFNFVYRISGVPGLPREPSRLADWHLTFGDSDNA